MKTLVAAALCLLLVTFPAVAAPLDGTWSGTSAGGATAEVTVDSGAASDITWRGKSTDVINSKSSEGGSRLDFTFARGSATLRRTAGGADLTIKETGRETTLVHVQQK